jgi:hypothetical protein
MPVNDIELPGPVEGGDKGGEVVETSLNVKLIVPGVSCCAVVFTPPFQIGGMVIGRL